MEGSQATGRSDQTDLHGALTLRLQRQNWMRLKADHGARMASWRRVWDKVIPFFAFPPEVRWIIYTTNAVESVNARLRKIIVDPKFQTAI